tara:strand:+ start:654 stop:878 length:225 start_codon:yes stop_codon:yes gene_type:complete
MNPIYNELYRALMSRYKTEIQECKSTIKIYFEQPVGIGDHSNHLNEMDQLMDRMTEASDKLKMLKKTFGEYSRL